jgi:hypothetical protein
LRASLVTAARKRSGAAEKEKLKRFDGRSKVGIESKASLMTTATRDASADRRRSSKNSWTGLQKICHN